MSINSKASKRKWQSLGIRGELNWKYRTGPFVVGSCNYPANSYIHAHSHQERCLSIIVRGVVFQFSSDREEILREGIVGFHPSTLLHRNYVGHSGATVLNISICEDWQLQNSSRFESGFGSFFMSKKCFKSAFEIFQSIRQNRLASCRMEEMIRGMSSNSNHALIAAAPPSRLANLAKQIIKEQIPDAISLSVIANQLKVHPSHLGREFRRAFHLSIGQYIKIMKLDLACQSLVNTDSSIANTAIDCGFSDQSDLTRFMKKTIGQTPGTFRDQFSRQETSNPCCSPARNQPSGFSRPADPREAKSSCVTPS